MLHPGRETQLKWFVEGILSILLSLRRAIGFVSAEDVDPCLSISDNVILFGLCRRHIVLFPQDQVD
jgi:hypothetical protein